MIRPQHRNGQRGFTLAEVMIAVAILGMIGGLTYGTFGRAIRAKDQAQAITGHYHQVRQAMLRMVREISTAFLSEHRDCSEPRTKTVFVAERAMGGTRIDFTSFSHFKMKEDANESDQAEISYFVARDPEDGEKSVLMRRSQSRIDEDPDEGGTEQVLAENVVDLQFELYDAKEDRWEKDWDSTNMDQRKRLPMFVSIHLKVKDPQGNDEEFVTKTRIFLKRPIHIAGTGFSPCPE